MGFHLYGTTRSMLANTADIFDAAAILDIDGVVDSVKTLEFQEIPINALAVLQGPFREINLLTGRYANLFANEGVKKFIECGFDFSKPFRYFAEMGGVEVCLVEESEIYQPGTKVFTPEYERMLRIVDDPAKAVVRCRDRLLYWVAKLHAPEITEQARDLIWQATKSVIKSQIKAGALEVYGIGPKESAEIWAPRLYNRELENLTKGTVTTSRVPAEYADLAPAVNAKIGDQVAEAINQALKGYNSSQECKLVAENHIGAGCVEVLYEGVDKLSASKRIIEMMDERIGHQIRCIVTFGDSYPDIMMAQAAVELRRAAVHFYLGSYTSFMEKFSREKCRPSVTLTFSQFDFMFKNNSNTASTLISSSALWWLVQGMLAAASDKDAHRSDNPLRPWQKILEGVHWNCSGIYTADYDTMG